MRAHEDPSALRSDFNQACRQGLALSLGEMRSPVSSSFGFLLILLDLQLLLYTR